MVEEGNFIYKTKVWVIVYNAGMDIMLNFNNFRVKQPVQERFTFGRLMTFKNGIDDTVVNTINTRNYFKGYFIQPIINGNTL